MKTNLRIIIICLVLFIFNSLLAQQQEVLLIVGVDTVTKEQFIATYSKNNALENATQQDLRDYLNLFINFKLKVNEGKAMKVDTSAAFQRELQSYRNQSAQQYLIDKEVTEALIDEAFEHSKYILRASHILIKCPSDLPKDTLAAYRKIINIRNKILGGLSFAEAAVTYSEDPSAQDRVNPQNNRLQPGNKGDLGYFTVFNLIYPFEVGAYKTPVGSISMPVKSSVGYHLIYVTDKVTAIDKITVSHIFITDTMAKDGKMTPVTKAKIDFIQEKLKKGVPFEDLVSEYSEDKGTIGKGGRLEPFSPQRRPGDFVKACISLKPGNYSEPIPSSTGWHIIKLISIDYIKADEDSKYALKNKIARDMRSYKSKESLVKKLKKEYQFEEKGKKAGFAFLTKNIPSNYFQSTDINIEELPGINSLKPLFTFADRKVSVQEYAKFISRFQGLAPDGGIEAFLEDKYPSFVSETMLKYENEHLTEKYPEFKNLFTEYHEGMILYEINSAEVWMKAVQDTTGLRNYYETVKHKYPSDVANTPKPFEEVKASIINEYQTYLEENWIARLREKYPVYINEALFSTIK